MKEIKTTRYLTNLLMGSLTSFPEPFIVDETMNGAISLIVSDSKSTQWKNDLTKKRVVTKTVFGRKVLLFAQKRLKD